MIVFLNGEFVAEEKAVVSVFDRGFLYGDGLFEGMIVTRGRPFRWNEHIERLRSGVAFLKLTLPYSPAQLLEFALQLIERNQMPDCILRLSLSRGITERGYSPKNATRPALVMTLHPAPRIGGARPPRWRVITSSFRLPAGDPLTRFKTANKLPQVLARAEADAAGAQEALLLNTAGCLAEGTTSNVFWVRDNVVCTPPPPSGALPGVTRQAILDLCVKNKIPWREKQARPAVLRGADGVFLTMTSMGVVEVEFLDGRRLKRSPLVKKLWADYRGLTGQGRGKKAEG
ncbi:MAG: aminotransferase class IV [Verrucomicrobiota bacterium]|jgi:aminodeoxychorismate lyase